MNRPLRVALVVSGGIDPTLEASRVPVFVHLARGLGARCDLHVFPLHTTSPFSDFQVGKATVHHVRRLRWPRLRLGQLALHLREAMKQHGHFDAVHGISDIPGLLAGLAAKSTGAASVVSLIGGELTCLPGIGYGAMQTRSGRLRVAGTLRLADAVTVSSEFMAKRVRAHGFTPVVVPLGLPPTDPPQLLRLSGPPWRLLFVGALSPVKDPTTLLRGMRALLNLGMAVTLDVVGPGPQDESPQRLAAQLGLTTHVRFHPWLQADALADFYARAHLLWLPSRDDAAPMVMLEAGLRSLPTVGTAVGYAADWHPTQAVAVPVGDAGQLACATQALLLDAPRREQMGAAARSWVLAHSMEVTAQAFADLYARKAGMGFT